MEVVTCSRNGDLQNETCSSGCGQNYSDMQ